MVSSSSTGPPPPVAFGSIPRNSTATSSLPRSASAQTVGFGYAFSLRPPSSASGRSPQRGRFVPAFLDLKVALDNSRLEQTYNTPALATLFLLANQVDFFLANGGLAWAVARTDRSAEIVYGWAERSAYAQAFVAAPSERSHVTATIDFDETVDALLVAATLAPTVSSTPSPTESSGATSCASRCSRP